MALYILPGRDIIHTMRNNFSGTSNPRWKGGKLKLKCSSCRKVIYKWPSRIKEKNYCSHSCVQKGKHPSSEFKKGHVTWIKGKRGIRLSPKTEFKKGVAPWNKGKHILLNKFSGKTYEEMYGKERADEIKKKVGIKSIGRKHTFKPTPETIRKMLIIRSPNKAEKFLNLLLQENFPREWEFVGDGKLVIEGKNPDFVNTNGKKLLIDLFGNHWHEESEVKPRIDTFAKYGYKTLIIWDKELKNEKEIIEKIKSLYL